MIKTLFLPSSNSPVLEWLGFILFLALLSIALGSFIVWLKVARGKKRKRKRKHRHRRTTNPTLADAGGLPPKRDPDVPPPGP